MTIPDELLHANASFSSLRAKCPEVMHKGTRRVDLVKMNEGKSREEWKILDYIPTKLLEFRRRCTSAALIFTQVKCVGDALKQNAG